MVEVKLRCPSRRVRAGDKSDRAVRIDAVGAVLCIIFEGEMAVLLIIPPFVQQLFRWRLHK